MKRFIFSLLLAGLSILLAATVFLKLSGKDQS
ncbi:hypothetical protein ABID29_000438 [Streptococcus rupicaprae]|uniref:Uncharacterized protein n=1 Tax=Streptococcus rupicaprae TaxID=759619 RepID=A0ABV2FFJ7_9STRE